MFETINVEYESEEKFISDSFRRIDESWPNLILIFIFKSKKFDMIKWLFMRNFPFVQDGLEITTSVILPIGNAQ